MWHQLLDSFMTGSCERKDCIWLSISFTLKPLRRRSESLNRCNRSAAGATRIYRVIWWRYRVKTQRKGRKITENVLPIVLGRDRDTIDTKRVLSRPAAPNLVGKGASFFSLFWHSFLISPHKNSQWYLHSILVTDTKRVATAVKQISARVTLSLSRARVTQKKKKNKKQGRPHAGL